VFVLVISAPPKPAMAGSRIDVPDFLLQKLKVRSENDYLAIESRFSRTH